MRKKVRILREIELTCEVTGPFYTGQTYHNIILWFIVRMMISILLPLENGMSEML